MNRSLSKILAIFSLPLIVCSCQVKKPEASQEREKWLLSLNDSIAFYKAEIDSASSALDKLNSEIGNMMPEFVHVSNPREVEGYYIYQGWKEKYPLTSTELAARISENEGLELIAALTGGVFDRISVEADGGKAFSATVPHDQALNYRAGNINTVCFTGAEADSVASFISSHEDSRVILSYIGGAKPVSITLSPDTKKMISATWQLYSAQKESHQLEKMMPLLSRKIDLCRRMLNEADSVKTK